MGNKKEERYIWLNGEIVHLSNATINVLSPTAQFGLNVFEGIRCYWNDKHQQLYAFRLDEHYKRLHNSMKMLKINDIYTDEQLQQGLVDVVRANEYREDIAVRQTVFIDGFGSWSATEPVNMFIAPIPKGRTLVEGKQGLRCCVSSWERISERNMSPRIKVGANYINSRMAQLEAMENGYDSAILLNHQGKVAEGPGSCLFIVRDGVLITPPSTASVLESITRMTITEIARSVLNIHTEEREIDRTELYISDEVFLCGSAMEIVPVLSVDRYRIGIGSAGRVLEQLFDTYMQVIRGEMIEFVHWLTPIYERAMELK